MSETDKPKKGWLARLKEGLTRSSSKIGEGIGAIFTKRKLDRAALDELEELLIAADLGPATAVRLTEQLAQGRFDKDIDETEVREALAASIATILEPLAKPLAVDRTKKPHVILVVGVNGSGKTTTTAKLAHRLKAEDQTVIVAACDTFRAAAVEQLKSWAERLKIEIVASHTGADSAAVAFDAWQAAKARGHDWLIVDTAGRLHTKGNLMEELAKIRRVLQKNDALAPQHRWLVVDGSLGANSIEQAKVFHQSFGLTGLVVTKLDGTSRGGAIVGIWRQLRIPIYFIGLGEQPDDLQPFSADNYARAVFGLEA